MAGNFCQDDVEKYLNEGMFFIPSEIGLPDLQDEYFGEDDHIWHEIEFIEASDEAATVEINSSELIERFRKAHSEGWNEYEVMERLTAD